MRRDISLTFQGALQILGHQDRPRLERLDKLLGGVILGAGVGAAFAATGVAALAPLGAVAAIWGWIDQKNEATSIARGLLDSVSNRLRGTAAYERPQLLVAAHTVIVISAFFEVMEQHLGDDENYLRLELTANEQELIALGRRAEPRQLLEILYTANIPAPPGRGFEETTSEVQEWMIALADRMERFFSGFTHQPRRDLNRQFIDQAVQRYRGHYLALAATVPEFHVWANLGEHPATRASVRAARNEILEAMQTQGVALARLEALLSVDSRQTYAANLDLRMVVYRANRGALDDRIVSTEVVRADAGISFPALREGFINPSYRIGQAGDEARPADEDWWSRQSKYDNLDLLFAGRVAALDAVNAPLLILGHPGAGKSLLTKVLASRLPPSEYTVVRVPLRQVNANVPIYEQIQQALNKVTHGRVDWWNLAEQSRDTVRIVLLDGLDELIQAAGHRSGYLQEVMEFQRREAEQERPVMVIVTSRTVVTNRVSIPRGSLMIKLEDFTPNQISQWLHVWNRCNEEAIELGNMRGLRPEEAMQQPELAAQPLLLLMLALYISDTSSPALHAGISSADLYRRLFESFTWRELCKAPPKEDEEDMEGAVREQLWRLSIAAFAMFNRGKQNVTDEELGSDLIALDKRVQNDVRRADLGRMLIAQFFFVHTAQARVRDDDTRYRYEFMHATFGEYLLAAQIVDMIKDFADVESKRRHGGREPNDDLLYALLSYQPLSSRRTTLNFAAQLFAEFRPERRESILRALETLIPAIRRRHGSDLYVGYRPTPLDRVRQLATYSANLTLLRVLLEPSKRLPLARLWRQVADPLPLWRSTVALWHAGLEADGWQSLLTTLKFVDNEITVMPRREELPEFLEDIVHAALLGDADMIARARFGRAIQDGVVYFKPGDHWSDVTWGWLASLLVPRSKGQPPGLLLDPSALTDRDEVGRVIDVLNHLLRTRAHSWTSGAVMALLEWLVGLPNSERYLDPYALAIAIAVHPSLLSIVPRLANPGLYASAPGVPLILQSSSSGEAHQLSEEIESLQGVQLDLPLEVRHAIDALLRSFDWGTLDEGRHVEFLNPSIMAPIAIEAKDLELQDPELG